MTGLAGLALACSASGAGDDWRGPRSVLLTDGHPHCVANMMVCIQLCAQLGRLSPHCSVAAQQLHWAAEGASGATQPTFEVVLAADCLFFTQSHAALIALLRRCLAPTGSALLLQPRRGGTMVAFALLAERWFSVERSEAYLESTRLQHEAYLALCGPESAYDPDIHLPELLVLRHLPPGGDTPT